jgi:hypothetical protein
MSQAFAESLTTAERDRVDALVTFMLSTALDVIKGANETAIGILGDAHDLCMATGTDLPPQAVELYAYLLPRQAVS